MKINHVVTSIDKSVGGPARSVTQLVQSILNTDKSLNLQLDTLECHKPVMKEFNKANGVLNFHKAIVGTYSNSLKNTLRNTDAQLYHGHGLWQWPVHQMAANAHRKTIPYIISPRGMLDVWSLQHKGFRKKLALWLFQSKDIKGASVLHATSQSEANNIRALGYNNPVALIPNGIDLPNTIQKKPSKHTTRSVLLLSRLIKNKGIEELLLAWSQLQNNCKSDWCLTIVGDGDPKYVRYLHDLRSRLALQNVNFVGAVYDKTKQDYLDKADLFVLPSYTENFGIAIAEALASCTPVITTKGTPWQELESHHCGWWIDIGVAPLKLALERAMQTNETTLSAMGNNGRQLIEDKYSSTALAKQMIELYLWILDKGPQPNFVSIH